jgi:hypothetical protein
MHFSFRAHTLKLEYLNITNLNHTHYEFSIIFYRNNPGNWMADRRICIQRNWFDSRLISASCDCNIVSIDQRERCLIL